MIRYLRLRWRIWRLERASERDAEWTDRAVAAARRRGASPAEIAEITGGDAGVIQRRIHEAWSTYLVSKAWRLGIPLPDWDDHDLWSVNSDTDEHVLTRAGIHDLRLAMRTERKARMELFTMWMPGVVGILGALIGLASVLMGRGGK